jgi:hypothetical protein
MKMGQAQYPTGCAVPGRHRPGRCIGFPLALHLVFIYLLLEQPRVLSVSLRWALPVCIAGLGCLLMGRA